MCCWRPICAASRHARSSPPRGAAASWHPSSAPLDSTHHANPTPHGNDMSALIFIVAPLLSLALFVVLARLLLQWARADFRNPIAQAVVRLTNPLILPLRRILPPVGKVDTASVVAVVLVACIKVAIIFALTGIGTPGVEVWVRTIAIELVQVLLRTYFYAILLYALLSLIAPGGYSP